MLKQRTLKTTIKTTGVGLHTGARVELVLRPARAGHRHRLPSRRPAAAGRHSRPTRCNVGDTRLSSTLKRDGASDLDRRAPDVGARRPRHRQPARRRRRARDADHGRQRRARSCSCCSRRASSSRTRRSATCASCSRSRCATATSGRASSPTTASSSTSRSTFRTRCSASENRHVVIDFAEHSYVKEVARARTFGFMQDVEAMRAAGLGARRQPAERDRAGRVPRAEQRGPALRQRVRQAQGARRDRRPVPARPPADRPVHGVQVRPRAQQRAWPARCSRAPTRSSSSRSSSRPTCRPRSRTGSSRRRDARAGEPAAAAAAVRPARRRPPGCAR